MFIDYFMSNSITQHTNLYTMSSNNDTFILFTHQWLRTLHLCKAEGFLANWKLTLSLLFLVWLTRDVSFSRKRKKIAIWCVWIIHFLFAFIFGRSISYKMLVSDAAAVFAVSKFTGWTFGKWYSVKLSPLTCDFYPEEK